MSLFDTGHSEDGVCYLVTEFVEGDTLQERLKQRRLEFRESAALVAELKYARGQLMKESCVKCHNAHQQSPKKNWKENELVGVLLITRPLDRDVERTQAGLQSAFVVMASAVLSLTGFAIIAAMRSRSQSDSPIW